MNRKPISLKIVVLLLLAFVGQVTASTAIYCEMMQSDSAQMSDHSGHDMSEHESSSNTQSTDSCCDDLGSCSMSGCIPVAFITTSETNDTRSVFTKILTPNKYLPAKNKSSLYRPPILS